LRVQAALLAGFPVLFNHSRLVFDAVVDLLTKIAFTLSPGSTSSVPVEQMKWFKRSADNAVLKLLGLAYVIVVKDLKRARLNDATIALIEKLIVV